MTTLYISNHYSKLSTDNEQLLRNIFLLFRKRKKGYFHSAAYKSRKWDGYINFFNAKTGMFASGLLPELITTLKHFKINYEIIDNRTKIQFSCDFVDKNFLDEKFPLYDYQVDFINQVIKYKKGIIHSPTSSGKSAIMICLVKCLRQGTKATILVNRKGLVEQIYEDLIKWKIPNIGRLNSDFNESGDIMIATIQSLHKIKDHVQQSQVLIVDEVHEMMGDEYKKCYKNFNNACVRVALSATPFKWDGKDEVQKFEVKGVFGPILKTKTVEGGILTTKILQERKTLSSSICTFYPINEPKIPFEVYQDAIAKGMVESIYFQKTVSKLSKELSGRTLILVERISFGDALQNMIPGSLWVQGKDTTESRKYVIDQLKKNKSNIIAIATKGIFNTGINVFIHNLINAAGGQADHEIIQRIGRGLRTAEDKEVLMYYDFIFNINEYLDEHSRNRIKILEREGHKIIKKEHPFL